MSKAKESEAKQEEKKIIAAGNRLHHEPLGNGKQVMGACRFCGQVRIFEDHGEETPGPAELDEMATDLCECEDARAFKAMKHAKEYAQIRIANMFPEAEVENVAKLLQMVADASIGSTIKKVVISDECGVKATLTITGHVEKPKVKVKREEKLVREETI